jgi:hypothetical protein
MITTGLRLASVMAPILLAIGGFPGPGLAQPAGAPTSASTFAVACPAGTYLTRIAWVEHARAVAGGLTVHLGTQVTEISCSSSGSTNDNSVVPAAPPPQLAGEAYVRTSQLDCEGRPLVALRQFVVSGRLEAFIAGCRTGSETLTPISDFPEYAYLFQGEGGSGLTMIEPEAGTDMPSLCEGASIGISGSRRGTLVTRLWLACSSVPRRGMSDRGTPQLPRGAPIVNQPQPCPTFRAEPGAGRDPSASVTRQLNCPEDPNPRNVVGGAQSEPAPPPAPTNVCLRRPDACRQPFGPRNIPVRPNQPAGKGPRG